MQLLCAGAWVLSDLVFGMQLLCTGALVLRVFKAWSCDSADRFAGLAVIGLLWTALGCYQVPWVALGVFGLLWAALRVNTEVNTQVNTQVNVL